MVDMNFSCPENIGEMTPTRKGRFCNSCQLDIIDYTAMSKAEICEQLKNASSKTCGIFKKKQIMNSNRVEIGSRFRLAFIMVFILGLSSANVLAQDTLTTFPSIAQTEGNTDYIIKGQVVDYDTLAVPFARVWIELDTLSGTANRIYAKTDFDGNFTLSIPKKIETPINLYAQSIGFDTAVVQGIMFIPFKNEVEVVVSLSELELNWIGIINICPPLIPKDPYEIGKTKLDGEDLRQWD